MPARIDLFVRTKLRSACVALFAVALSGLVCAAHATFYQVNSPADVPDANTATAACETAAGNGVCTLRAAVQQANAHAGLDTILLPANTYVLSRIGSDDTALNGDLDITDAVTIIGAGAGKTIIDANGTVTGDRVFELIGSIKVSLYKLTIRNGLIPRYGGGVAMIAGAQALIDGCTITGNSATSFTLSTLGAGIANFSTGSLVIKNSIVSDNSATAYGSGNNAYGGGIYSSGPLTISNSTITGNSAAYGGGLYVPGPGVVDAAITNSTFSGNSATTAGGGIYASSGTVRLYNATVAENVANADQNGSGSGAGIFTSGATVTLHASILAGNYYFSDGSPLPALADCDGTLESSGGNIVSNPSCTINGSYSAVDPVLGPLQDNGGPTPTHALLPGSPAVEAGGACFDELGAALTTDQRGVARPQGAACDLGAFELEDRVFANGFEAGA